LRAAKRNDRDKQKEKKEKIGRVEDRLRQYGSSGALEYIRGQRKSVWIKCRVYVLHALALESKSNGDSL
jgi:hypothetical protein